MTAPFFVIYLHRVRGIDLTVAGLALATVALASFVGNVVAGRLADGVGSRRTLMMGLCCSASGASWFAFVHDAPAAFGAAAIIGLGASISWPAVDALLASTVDAVQRSGVFALRHATLNVGFGVGALAAAAIVASGSRGSFEVLYLIDAATFVAVVPVLASLRATGNRPSGGGSGEGGYRDVLADRTFRWVWALTALVVTVGYAQYQGALPPYATGTGGISAHALALVFAVNTLSVAVLQLFVLRALAGRRRSTGICTSALAFAGAWAIAIAAAHVGGSVAIAGFALTMLVLAVAETLLAPSLAPIVNDLAPERLRGRYNGAFVLAYTTGFMLGPALAGSGLKIGDGTPFFILLVAGCLGAAIGARALRRRLVPAIDVVAGVTVEAPALQQEMA